MSAPNWQNIPNAKFTVDEKGMNNVWSSFYSNNNTELTHYFSDSGYLIPDLTETQINNLDANSTKNRLIVDSTNNVLKINLNGVFETVATV
jgi:hypothetical protein